MRLWSVVALALAWVGHASGQEGFRPPVYTEALWLPENFIPGGFTADEDRPMFADPPRSNGSQRIVIRVPRPDGSGHDNWIWCFIDGMLLHRSAEDARGFVAWLVRPQGGTAPSFRRVSLGDEAYIDEGRLRGYLGQDNISYADAGGFLIKENVSDNRQGGAIVGGSIWRRNLLVDPVRVGRMTVGLRVEGMAISQSAHGKWEIVRPVPTGEELVAVARKVVAAIDEEHCCGCRICNNLCPYNAIEYLEDTNVSRVITSMCKGCGTCVAGCPSEAIVGTQFSNEQIFAQLAGLLMMNVDGSPVRVLEPVAA